MPSLSPTLTLNTQLAQNDPLAGWRAIHEMGRRARLAGESTADCPRDPFTLAALVWLAGFTGSSLVLEVGEA